MIINIFLFVYGCIFFVIFLCLNKDFNSYKKYTGYFKPPFALFVMRLFCLILSITLIVLSLFDLNLIEKGA